MTEEDWEKLRRGRSRAPRFARAAEDLELEAEYRLSPATFEYVAQMPRAYPRFGSSNPRLQDLRRRRLTGAFDRYLVFFRQGVNEFVDVVRVLHSARDIDKILDEA